MSKKKPPSRRTRSHDSVQQEEEARVLNRVSFRLRAREGVLGWVLAAYTAWVGVVVMPGALMPWFGIFMAVMMAAWARARPARKPGKVAMRYGLLCVVALLLLVDPRTGGVTGPLVLWPGAIACAAVFMLRARWALMVVGMALAVVVAAAISLEGRAPWLAVSTALVAMLAATAMVYAFGNALRNTDAQLEAAMTDLKTKLYNETGFFTYGAELLAQCRARKKPLSMVVLNGSDLKDIRELAGRIASERMISQAVQGITAALPAGGLAAHMSEAEFAVLVPEALPERAMELVRHKLGDPPGVHVKIKGQSIAVVFDMLCEEVPSDATSLELIYERLYAQISKMRRSLESPSTSFSEISYMPDPQREISPTLPMDLIRKVKA
jgi:GGDEF domain-containing protein